MYKRADFHGRHYETTIIFLRLSCRQPKHKFRRCLQLRRKLLRAVHDRTDKPVVLLTSSLLNFSPQLSTNVI